MLKENLLQGVKSWVSNILNAWNYGFEQEFVV